MDFTMDFDIKEALRKAEGEVKAAQAKRKLLREVQDAMSKGEASSRAVSEKRLEYVTLGTKVSRKLDEATELRISTENNWNQYELKRNEWIARNCSLPEYQELVNFVTKPGSRHTKPGPYLYTEIGQGISIPANKPNDEKITLLASATELSKQLSALLEEELAIEKTSMSKTKKDLELETMVGAWQAAEKEHKQLVAEETRSKAELGEAWKRWQQGLASRQDSVSATGSKRASPEISPDDESNMGANPAKKTRLILSSRVSRPVAPSLASTTPTNVPAGGSREVMIFQLHSAWAGVRDSELFLFHRTAEIRKCLRSLHKDCHRLMNILDWAEKLAKLSRTPAFEGSIEGTKFYDLLIRILKRGKLWSTERFSSYLEGDQEGRGRYKVMKAEYRAALIRGKQFERV